MKNRDYYNCVFPEKRPRSVWVVYDTQGSKIGEVAAMSETEARQKVAQHVMIPFTLSHIPCQAKNLINLFLLRSHTHI